MSLRYQPPAIYCKGRALRDTPVRKASCRPANRRVENYCIATDLSPVAKDDVEENGEVMTGAARDDEDVPYRVGEWEAASGEECDADGVEKSASE